MVSLSNMPSIFSTLNLTFTEATLTILALAIQLVEESKLIDCTGDVIETRGHVHSSARVLCHFGARVLGVCVARTEALAVGEYYPPPSQEPGNETSISLSLIPRL